MIFKGSGTALVTPFKEDHSVDFQKLEELVNWQIENKTDALIICGTTGEASTLTDDEQIECIRTSVAAAKGRIPIVAGAGSNDTAHGIQLAKECEKAGADGLLIVTPYYNKTSQKGLIEHYTMMAQSVSLPVIMYNVPSRTGMNILPQTACTLSKVENIVGIKEASSNISQITELAALCEGRLDLYSGNDDQIVPILAVGGIGVISVLSNVAPEDTHNMVQYYLDGKTADSAKLQLKYISLIKALFSDVSPMPVKEIMNMMGLNVGPCRRPLCQLEANQRDALQKTLKEYHLI